jgi:hypothetical protein
MISVLRPAMPAGRRILPENSQRARTNGEQSRKAGGLHR